MNYEEFINNILETRGRFNCGDEYHERHHIVARCMGGTDEEENLIDLYAKEHFEAHRLLALENPENDGLIYAWSCMAFVRGENSDRYEVTAEEYEEARIALSELRTGKPHSEKSRKKMSKSQQKRLANPEDNPMFGKHHTAESKRKIGDAKRGKYRGDNNPLYRKQRKEEVKIKMSEGIISSPIIQLELDGTFVAEHASAYVAYLATGISNKNILNCCHGNSKSSGGFMWLFKKNYDTNATYTYNDNSKRTSVIQMDLFGNFITEHPSINEASKKVNGLSGCVYQACTSKSHMMYGFLWVFKEDYDPCQTYTYSNSRCIPVVCLDLEGNYIREYKSITEAYSVTGVDGTSIVRCCKRKQKTSGGFKWMYKEDWEAMQGAV